MPSEAEPAPSPVGDGALVGAVFVSDEVLAVALASCVVGWSLAGRRVAWRTDSIPRRIAAGGGRLVVSTLDGALLVLDGASGRLLARREGLAPPGAPVALRPDGAAVAVAQPGGVALVGVDEGEPLGSLRGLAVDALRFSADGARLGALVSPRPGRRGVLWESASGQVIHQVSTGDAFFARMAVSPDGQSIAAATSDRRLLCAGALSGDARLKVVPRDLVFLPDGSLLLASAEGLHLIAGGKARPAVSLGGAVDSLSVSPSGGSVAAVVDGALSVWKLSINSGKLSASGRAEVAAGAGPIVAACLDGASGEVLALHGGPAALRRWSPRGELRSEVSLQAGGKVTGQLLPSASRAALLDDRGALRLVDTTTGALIRSLDERSFEGWTLASSPDGAVLVAHDLLSGVAWDAGSGRRLFDFSAGLRAVSFSPRGDALVAAGDALRLLSARDGGLLRAFSVGEGIWQGAALCRDAGQLAAFNVNRGAASLWDTRSGKVLAVSPPLERVSRNTWNRVSMRFSPDDREVWLFGPDGAARWRLDASEVSPIESPGVAQDALWLPGQGAWLWGPDGVFWRMPR